MKHQKDKVDLSGWELEAMESLRQALEPVVLKAASEALQLALEDDATYAYLPIEWDFADGDEPGTDGHGDPPVEDPLTVYVIFGLWTDDANEPVFKFTLRDLVTELIDGVIEHKRETAPEAHTQSLSKLRDALREQADRIDAIIHKT